MAKTRRTSMQKAASAKFSAYMNSLSVDAHREATAVIREKCMVKYHTIASWKAGTATIRPLYQKTIEEALGVKIFD